MTTFTIATVVSLSLASAARERPAIRIVQSWAAYRASLKNDLELVWEQQYQHTGYMNDELRRDFELFMKPNIKDPESQNLNTNPVSFQNRNTLIMRGRNLYFEMDGYLHMANSPQGAVPHRIHILTSNGQATEIQKKVGDKWDVALISNTTMFKGNISSGIHVYLYSFLTANSNLGRALLPLPEMIFTEREGIDGIFLVGTKQNAKDNQVDEYIFDPRRHYTIVKASSQRNGVTRNSYVAEFDPKRPRSPIPMQTTSKIFIDGRQTVTRTNRFTGINEGIRNSNIPMELNFQPGTAVFDSTVNPMITSIVRKDGSLYRIKSPADLNDRERIIEVTK